MSDPQNLTERLEQLTERLRGGPVPGDLQQLAGLLTVLGGGPVPGDLRSLITSVTALRGPEDATLSTLLNTDEFVSAQVQLNAKLLDLYLAWNPQAGLSGYELLEQIGINLLLVRDAIGTPTGDATTTVLGRLAAIQRLLTTQVSGLPPVIGTTDVISTGNNVIEGRKYATFGGSIPGVLITDGGRTLTHNFSWSGYSFYIQTTDPAPQVAGTATAPNVWEPLSGNSPKDFSVEWQYPISVTIRAPALSSGPYIWYSNEQELRVTQFGNRYFPVYEKYPGSFSKQTNGDNTVSILGNWGGWSVRNAGSTPYAIWALVPSGGGGGTASFWTISGTTSSLSIQTYGGSPTPGTVKLWGPGQTEPS